MCASGLGTSRLLVFRIRSRFAESVNHIESVSLEQLKKTDLSKFDMIVSTVPLPGKYEIPVISVKYSLSEEDVLRISDVINETDEDVIFARNMFRRSLFFKDQSFRSPEQAIHFLCAKLAEETELPAGFEKAVLEREKLTATDLGYGIAMPHPVTPMMEKTSLAAVCHLKKPLRWGKQKVTWIFLLAAKKDGQEAYTLFSHVLYQLVNDQEMIRRLTERPSFELLEKEISDLTISHKSEKEESIFQ